MLPGTFKDPAITVNGVATKIPCELTSGSWFECNGPGEYILYGPKGEILSQASLPGRPPLLRAGRNEVQFSCASGNGPSPRVKVTVFTRGEKL
jgi:hypothetical protein